MKFPNCCPAARFFSFAIFAAIIGAGTALSLGAMSSQKEDVKMLRHVVLFKFKDTSSKEDVAKIVEAFRKLPSKIPAVADFEFGTDNSPEKLANGFTHCFFLTFKTEKDREEYLPHAAHKEFIEIASPHIDKVLVVDYWAGK